MISCGACCIGRACGVDRGDPCLFAHRRRRAGESIYLEGQPAATSWLIKTGTVVLVRALSRGDGERVRAIRGEGSLIGLETIVGGAYLDTARVLSESLLCALPSATLLPWLGDTATPARMVLAQTVRESLVDEPRGAGPDGSATRRVARWILDGPARGVEPQVPRGTVASMLGMVPETLSRALAELSRSGAIVATRRKIVIRDRDQLLRAAGAM